jgi:hypothetical protein
LHNIGVDLDPQALAQFACDYPVQRINDLRARDHTLFWNASDLERKLADLQSHYNGHRTHRSLSGDTPSEMAGCTPKIQATLNNFRWQAQ